MRIEVHAVVEVTDPDDGSRRAKGARIVDELVAGRDGAGAVVVDDADDVGIGQAFGRVRIIAVVDEDHVACGGIVKKWGDLDTCLFEDESGFVVDFVQHDGLGVVAKRIEQARIGDCAAHAVGIRAVVACDVDRAVDELQRLQLATVQHGAEVALGLEPRSGDA